MPDDNFKKKYDLLITMMLLFTAVVSPYRIAFVEVDDFTWIMVEYVTDLTFFIDMCLNFFFAYYDGNDEVVDNRRIIAMNYLKGWFGCDILTVLPIS